MRRALSILKPGFYYPLHYVNVQVATKPLHELVPAGDTWSGWPRHLCLNSKLLPIIQSELFIQGAVSFRDLLGGS